MIKSKPFSISVMEIRCCIVIFLLNPPFLTHISPLSNLFLFSSVFLFTRFFCCWFFFFLLLTSLQIPVFAVLAVLTRILCLFFTSFTGRHFGRHLLFTV